MTSRATLPNRRHAERLSFVHNGQRFFGTLGFPDVTSESPIEVFLDGGRPGSGLNAMARDFAVVVSIALQYGVPLDVMRKAITRLDDGLAAGPGGQLLDLIGGKNT